MDDVEREDILRRSWEVLNRDYEAEHAEWIASRADKPDALERWAAGMPKSEPVQSAASPLEQRTHEMDAATQAMLEARFDARVSDRLEQFAELMGEEVARATNEVIGKLRAEHAVQIQALKSEIESLRAIMKGEVIDLPRLPRMGRHAA